ncbi:MAG: hypothetical protein JWQ96_3358 [Segetibacter sp.]|nr:hypothetical protein [Segetibacter sp.]
MKCKILLILLASTSIASVSAQKKQQKKTAFAITASQKGSSAWGEVKLVDITTGEEIKTIYSSNDQVEVLNARTGKPVVKKDAPVTSLRTVAKEGATTDLKSRRKIIIRHLDDGDASRTLHFTTTAPVQVAEGLHQKVVVGYRTFNIQPSVQTDKPFSTFSAACAYDKKHERLYYTPMGINQLRYIDLKSTTPKVYYFEDEPFGALTSRRDVGNQITRMVLASDGNGYALTNNGEHLIRFTTKKKAQITDLGALTDDGANSQYSITSGAGYGGDMIADNKGKLYLITANKVIFKIDPATKVASYVGTIKGLPRGYSTNGAVVEEGTTVIVNSANSTQGYFKFNLKTLQAEAITSGEPVFNASDLANGTLLSDKKNKDEENPEEVITAVATSPKTDKTDIPDRIQQNNVAVFPNPVNLGGAVKLSFNNQVAGKYTIQFMDIAGKLIESRPVTISNKLQVEEYKLPKLVGKGNYLIKVMSDANKPLSINTIIVQ